MMKANLGGQIDPSEVIGRDGLILRLWRVLERQSLVLSAERRMGKTCLVRKMEAEVPKDSLPVYRDLERVHRPLEFVELVFQDVKSYLSRVSRTAKRVRALLTQLSGGEIGDLIKFPSVAAPHWKTLLTKTIEDLAEHQERTVVFFWDEVPLMLHNIKKKNGEDVAMEILDTLRALRQTHRELRMVFTGSIGLHNVISSLREAGYANDPTNDMQIEEVPPLAPADAKELALRLIEGEEVSADDPEAVAESVASSVDGIPFYIHHVVDRLKQRAGVLSVSAVKQIVNACLTEPLDPWHMRHYRQRIGIYYSPAEASLALGLLDAVAGSSKPLIFDELFNLLKHRQVTEDREEALRLLKLLQSDHYLLQETNGAYRFRFPLIKRWWRYERGLTL